MSSPARHSPRATAAAADAHAPVPHASVMPLPRSNTRIRSRAGESACTNSAFTPPGNASLPDSAAPTAESGTRSASGTNTTACGLPTDTGTQLTGPCPGRSTVRSALTAAVPMSTLTRSAVRSCGYSHSRRGPAAVSIVSSVFFVSPRSNTYLPTQRIPLPHISPSLPSALKIRIRKSAFLDGRIRMIPSAPAPK